MSKLFELCNMVFSHLRCVLHQRGVLPTVWFEILCNGSGGLLVSNLNPIFLEKPGIKR